MPGNAQRAGGGQGLKKPLRFSCRFHVIEFMSDLSIFLTVAVYAWIYIPLKPTGFYRHQKAQVETVLNVYL